MLKFIQTPEKFLKNLIFPCCIFLPYEMEKYGNYTYKRTPGKDFSRKERYIYMNMNVKKRLLEALKCFLEGEKVQWESGISGEEWGELFDLAIQHQILPMVYEAVYACPAFGSMPDNQKDYIKHRMIQQVMVQGRKTAEFLALYSRLLEKSLTPIVVKGIICREMYREPDYRASGDEDVLIPSEQFTLCDQVFRENAMDYLEPEKDPEKEGEVPYYKKGGLLHIELHKELFPAQSEAYGELNEMFRNVFQRKIQTEIQGIPVYTMGHTDHLLYLILHAFKHFLHSGFGIRQVCDIVIYANTYGSEIDWEYLYQACQKIRGENFTAALFHIGEKYLNFDKEQAHYPAVWQEEEADGEALLDDLLQGGVFGDSSLSRKHSSNMTLAAVTDEKKGKKAKASLASSLFPDKEYMAGKYTYLEKYPFLLPAAWGSRILNYMKETKGTKNNDAKESIEIGNQRIELLKKYKIIR